MNKKLIVGITAEGSVNLLLGQLNYFHQKGYETYLISPLSDRSAAFCKNENCEHLIIDIERDIALFQDFKTLLQIIKIFKRVKPDVVNLGTPKVSLLGLMAARILGVKKRIYTCRGFRFEHETGMKRKILIAMEKITAACAHQVICISPSLKEYAVKENIFNKEKTYVINKGSSNGLNLVDFSVDNIDLIKKKTFLKENNLEGKFIFGFVGRLVEDKGIFDLLDVFVKLYELNKDLSLLILGSEITSTEAEKKSIEKYRNHPAILFLGYQNEVPFYMSIFDVMVLPSHREGFGNVYIQAAALGVACIGCNIIGVKDAISHNFNGLLIQPRSQVELKSAMEKLYLQKDLAEQFGKNGLVWAKNFDREIIWKGLDTIYQS
jgi:glycosyltransferase involved in cell wall biosynthesis